MSLKDLKEKALTGLSGKGQVLTRQVKNIFRHYLAFWKKMPIIVTVFHLLVIVIFGPIITYAVFLKAPANFPQDTMLSIKSGQTLSEIASTLKKENLVKSPFWFKNIVRLFNGQSKIKAGEYFLERPENSYVLAERIISGNFGLYPLKVTVHEGLNVFEISKLLGKILPNFDENEFLKLAEEKEGFLFPDTYFLTPNSKTESVIIAMEKNFQEKTSAIKNNIESFGQPIEEIVKMASIIETEARDQESRRIISGILWKRLQIGMPLQVDVTFKYINGKNSYELTSEDLKTDSPYNTYLYTGLPPTPIANPGLDAILAAIEPIETDYFYFMSDTGGKMHYAVTHDEHVKNKSLYLYN